MEGSERHRHDSDSGRQQRLTSEGSERGRDASPYRPRGPEFPAQAQRFIESLTDQIAQWYGIDSGLIVVHEGVLYPELTERMGEVALTRKSPTDFVPKSGVKNRLVVGILQWGGQRGSLREQLEANVELTSCISSDGWGLFMLPSFHRAFRELDFDRALRRRDVSLHAVINSPTRFLGNGFRPVFVVVSPIPTDNVFLIDAENSFDLDIRNLFEQTEGDDIRAGIRMNLTEFTSFEHWRVQKEITSLEGDFGQFTRHRLEEIAFVHQIPSGENFDDIFGSIYLPKIGNGLAVDKLAMATMKHHNYLQVIVNSDVATPEYLCAYFNSKHFRLYLEAEKNSRSLVIPSLTARQARSLPIALPSLDIQGQVSSNLSKLDKLKGLVDELSQFLSPHPLAEAQVKQIDEALAIFDRLTEEEIVLAMIRDGESKTVEFKRTLSFNDKNPRGSSKDKDLELATLKSIAGFANADGGELFVGVHDEGHVVGLSEEIRRFHNGKEDTFNQHLRNLLHERIGPEIYPFVDARLISVKGQRILRVTCRPSNTPVFVDRSTFYYRTNPSTIVLVGRDLVRFLNKRYPGAD